MRIACLLILHLRAEIELQRQPALKDQPVVIIDRSPRSPLVRAGSLDAIMDNRRQALWAAGLTLRPTLGPDVLSITAVEGAKEGAEVLVAGWAIARQHPKGRDGTVFVTVEDEEGDVQLILWPRVYERYRREMANDLILLRGVADRWDGTANVIVSEVQALEAAMPMPPAHDWH